MAQARKGGLGLGKGLDSLIPMGMGLGGIQKSDQKPRPEGSDNRNSAAHDGEEDEKRQPVLLKLSLVEPNREQPRKQFDEEALNELAESIKRYGIIQPLLVQKREDYYEIIARERRWRAAKLAKLK